MAELQKHRNEVVKFRLECLVSGQKAVESRGRTEVVRSDLGLAETRRDRALRDVRSAEEVGL